MFLKLLQRPKLPLPSLSQPGYGSDIPPLQKSTLDFTKTHTQANPGCIATLPHSTVKIQLRHTTHKTTIVGGSRTRPHYLGGPTSLSHTNVTTVHGSTFSHTSIEDITQTHRRYTCGPGIGKTHHQSCPYSVHWCGHHYHSFLPQAVQWLVSLHERREGDISSHVVTAAGDDPTAEESLDAPTYDWIEGIWATFDVVTTARL
jgi:hypothetical protein